MSIIEICLKLKREDYDVIETLGNSRGKTVEEVCTKWIEDKINNMMEQLAGNRS